MAFRNQMTSMLLLSLANVLIPVGMLVFMTGLFRSRPVLEVTDFPKPSLEPPVHEAPFDKVIFMMVDALRSDFVFAEDGAFPFTQNLIRSGAAVPITALSAMPTLTLSRIKALTQGSSQSFLDAWLNVVNWPEDSRLDGGDTWLARLKTSRDNQKKLVFYGIEEWVDLYPNLFDRMEDFSSFHLPRLVDVDRNVTRNLFNELPQDDWTALVLHYLGLDCIAHMGGSKSAHMQPKQLEMDAVVRDIYTALNHEIHLQDTLLVLLGDHGMTSEGNHGGRRPEELAAAAVFISPKLRDTKQSQRYSPATIAKDYLFYSSVNQIDMVPTLSGLLGFPIPSRSSGIFISDLLPAFKDDKKAVEFLVENAKQIHNAFQLSRRCPKAAQVLEIDRNLIGCHDSLGRTDDLWETVLLAEQDWIDTPTNEAREHLKSCIYEFATDAQTLLLRSVDNVSISRMQLGVSGLAVATALTYTLLHSLNFGIYALFFATTFHSATMFIPSLVEEEHHYWYCASLAWLTILSILRIRQSRFILAYLGLIALHFLGQCVNRHGTQHSIAERIDNVIFAYPITLWLPAFLSHLSAFVLIAKSLRNFLSRGTAFVLSLALSSAAFIFKLSSVYNSNPESFSFVSEYVKNLVASVPQDNLLQAFWTGLLACSLFVLWAHQSPRRPWSSSTTTKAIVHLLNLYLRTQSRPKNLFLFLIFEYQFHLLSMMHLSPAETATTVVLLGQSAFYSMGRDNTIASLDLMNGFNGLGESSVIGVVVQSFLTNWIGPVWWSLAGLRLLTLWAEKEHGPAIRHLQNRHGGNGHIIQEQSNSGDAGTAKSLPKTSAKLAATHVMKETRSLYIEYLTLHTLFSALSSLVFDVACIYIWGHEDLWHVYAPKFINAFLWVFFHQLMVNSIGCSFIWFLARN